jgi:raffinose/stachyose/melibiose transport system substrate-binding protein
MKVLRFTLMLLVVSALLLSACAAPPPPPQATEASGAPAPAGAEISGDFVYWALWNEGEPQQQALSEIIDAFEQQYPDVNVQVTWAGREVLTKARSALLAGAQLDLVDQAGDELNAALFKNGLGLPLDDMLEEKAYGEDVAFKDIFVPGVLDPYKWKDQVVFIPYEIITSGFWYDENMWNENNISPPQTWDELMQICEQLKAKDIACFAQDGTEDWYNAYYFYWMAERIFGPGGWYNAVTDSTGQAWDDPRWLEVVQKVQEPVKKGYFMKGFEGSIWPAGQVAWSQGEAATILCGSWVPNETAQTAKEGFKYRGFRFPEVAGGAGKITEVEMYLLGWAIPKDAKNPEAAKAFIKFAMQEQYQTKTMELGQNMVSRQGIPAPDVLPDIEDWFATSTNSFKIYDGVQADFPSLWATVLAPMATQVLHDKITPEEFVTSMKAKVVDYWSKPTPTPEAIR